MCIIYQLHCIFIEESGKKFKVRTITPNQAAFSGEPGGGYKNGDLG